MDEDLAPVLRIPDNVVLARKDDVPPASTRVGIRSQYTARRYLIHSGVA